MIEVSGLMRPHQLDHAQPQPWRRIERLGSVAGQFRFPASTRRPIHLTRMRAPDDARQVSRDRRCLLAAELLDLDLEVLRHQLPHGRMPWATKPQWRNGN